MTRPLLRSIRASLGAPLIMTLVFVALFGLAAGPGRHVPVDSDTDDYEYGALALLHGGYQVEWPGVSLHIPRYPPGFALLLTPAVALGGGGAAGVVGRFGLLCVPLTLIVCVPYYWQSGRYLLLPGALLGLAAATLIVEATRALAQRVTRGLTRPPFPGPLMHQPRFLADGRARKVHPT